jgi:hypothetical protein
MKKTVAMGELQRRYEAELTAIFAQKEGVMRCVAALFEKAATTGSEAVKAFKQAVRQVLKITPLADAVRHQVSIILGGTA